jgi:dTDP-4-dehydrorhamnose reductase
MHSTIPRILLIGNTGQVGWELERSLATLGEVVAAGRNTLPHRIELTDPDSMRHTVREVQPDWIVNAAAYTAVDKAEQEEAQALRINGEAPGVLAELAKEINAALVHYSTDYVFDGKARVPYREDDPANPLNAYGRTKLAGETNIQTVGGKYLIFRTSWIYGLRGKNFLLTLQRLAREREELRIVADQLGSPTWCRNIAEATTQIISQMIVYPDLKEQAAGLYHLSADGQTSWHGFAEAIVTILRKYDDLVVKRIRTIETHEYPLPAERPAFSVLSNKKVYDMFSIHMPDWSEALNLCCT